MARFEEYFPFKRHYLQIGDHKIHYVDEGGSDSSKPTLLMVHGNPSWSFYWRNLILALRSQYRVVAIDHMGCGFSDKPQDYSYRLSNHIKNLKALIQELKLQNISLFMHDWGGAIGMGFATEYPESISSLIIFNTAAFPSKRIPVRIAICRIPIFGKLAVQGLNGFAKAATFMATAKGMSRDIRKAYLKPYNNFANRIATYEFVQDIPMKPSHPSFSVLKNIETKLPLLKMKPMIILWGEKDWCFDQSFLATWKEKFPSAETHTFPQAGHYVVEDAHREIIPLVNDFLQRQLVSDFLPRQGLQKQKDLKDTTADRASSDSNSDSDSEKNYNISRLLTLSAEKFPTRTATVFVENKKRSGSKENKSMDFQTMEAEAIRMAKHFRQHGITSGMRVVTFIKPGPEFVPVIFALFRLGAVPVFIDPGMKLKNILACLKEVEAKAMVGIPLAHLMRIIFRSAFRFIKIPIAVGNKTLLTSFLSPRWVRAFVPGKLDQQNLKRTDSGLKLSSDSPAAIIFTSGSTGVPKGVELTHGVLDAQSKILKECFNIREDEIDLVVFPLFALFSAAWGITSIIPHQRLMNPARPARVKGRALADLIEDFKVTHSAGSPAIWKRMLQTCVEDGRKLPNLRRLLIAGAPVSGKILENARRTLTSEGFVYTPYGSTEALPLTSIRDDELLDNCLEKTKNGAGTCVGRPLAGIKIKIIQTSDAVLSSWSEVKELPQTEIGEIVVQGSIVTRSYFNRPLSNLSAKIADGKTFWHRMGDLGYFDANGRLWFCGRKDHRIRKVHGKSDLYPVQCEGIFNVHSNVVRTAVVGVATADGASTQAEEPVLVVQTLKELRHSRSKKEKLKSDLIALAKLHSISRPINRVIFRKDFPVDVRHNIKINRPLLARFVTRELARTESPRSSL